MSRISYKPCTILHQSASHSSGSLPVPCVFRAEERIREVFISMDTDSDGHVTVEELRVGLERCGITGLFGESMRTAHDSCNIR